MSQFILIDHSLSGPGSHHFEYASHILRAAAARGWQTVLAGHERFRVADALPDGCRVFPLFPYTTYGGNTLTRWVPVVGRRCDRGARHFSLRPMVEQARATVLRWRNQRRHGRRLEAFAGACRRLFASVGLHAGDHVFLPTLSDFDLLALGTFLRGEPAARRLVWHLQCHFSFLEGRAADYADQAQRIAAMRGRFREALCGLETFDLRFYSTTAAMAAQYNLLGVVPFRELPYPVNPVFQQPPTTEEGGKPLRIVCAGNVRDEKGGRWLRDVVEGLHGELAQSGELQLWIQGQARRVARRLGRPVRSVSLSELATGRLPDDPVLQIPFPLDKENYARLIRGADCGLFLYDSERYDARCSGVLVEMLSSGVPVVVPAGCWLAGEIAEARQDYLAEHPPDGPTCVAEFRGASGADRMTLPAAQTFDVPAAANGSTVWLVFRGADAGGSPAYVRWDVTSLDARGRRLGRDCQIVDARRARPTRLVFQRSPHATAMEVSVRNAYRRDPLVIQEARLSFPADGGAMPVSAVGCTFADLGDVLPAVREIVRHAGHYRRTAAAFAESYRAAHSPDRTLRDLLEGRPATAGRPHPAGRPVMPSRASA